MLRFLTAGESHGPALVVTIEGLPAGLPLLLDDVSSELARRRLGYGGGPRMRFEADDIEFLGGVRHGRTIGSPVAVLIHNSEWKTGKWADEMSAAPGQTAQPLTQPRPGRQSRSPSPAPATPTSRACRSTASPTPATCSSERRLVRPRRASRPA